MLKLPFFLNAAQDVGGNKASRRLQLIWSIWQNSLSRKRREKKLFCLLEEKEMRRPKQFNLLSVKCIRRIGVLHSWMLRCHCQTLLCWLLLLELWAVGIGVCCSCPTQAERSWGRFYRCFETEWKKLFKYFETEMQAIYTLFRYEWHSHLETVHLSEKSSFSCVSRLLHHQHCHCGVLSNPLPHISPSLQVPS